MCAKTHPDEQDLGRRLRPALTRIMEEKRSDYDYHMISIFLSYLIDPHRPALITIVSRHSTSGDEISVEKH